MNTELILLYQSIGQTLLERTESEAWGSGVITQLANDLRAEFPEMKGFSPSNLKYMRLFARGWPDGAAIGQQPAGQLPWGHLMLLLDKLDTLELRDWYAAAAVRHGWTRDVLRHQIATAFRLRAPEPVDQWLKSGSRDGGKHRPVIVQCHGHPSGPEEYLHISPWSTVDCRAGGPICLAPRLKSL